MYAKQKRNFSNLACKKFSWFISMNIMILFNFLVATDDDLSGGLFPDINLVSRTSR